MNSIISKAQNWIREVQEQWELEASIAVENGGFPGSTLGTVECQVGSISCLCTHREGTYLTCDVMVTNDLDEELYANCKGEITGSIDAVAEMLSHAISDTYYE